jgi:hypothetical protein
MAQQLTAFPDFPARYPWGEWLNGSAWQLGKGDDYRCRTETFLHNARMQASKRGGTVRTRTIREGTHESVVIQFRAVG